MQAVVLDDLLACKPSDVCRNLCAYAKPLAYCLKRACRCFWKRESRAMSHPHRKQVCTEHTFRALDDEPALQRPYVPRYLDVRRATLALRCHAPLIEQKVGIASVCAIVSFHVLGWAQERLGEIYGVHALV